MSYTKLYYLSQEIQSKLQVLQPLSVDGVNFGELGSKSRFLQESSQQTVNRLRKLGQVLKSLAFGDRG